MKAKKSVQIFILVVFLPSMLFCVALYIYDPLQVFHKHWNRDNTLSSNMRQQIVGIVKHNEFNSIIFGSSQLENTSANETSQKLGGKYLNLSVSGSDYFERAIILKYLLNKYEIRTVIYSLDNLEKIRRGHPRYPVKTFDYLYDNNPVNDFKVYLNNKYINCLMSFSKNAQCVGHKLNIDRPNAWYKKVHHKFRFGGLENWFKGDNNKRIIEKYKYISKISKRVKNHKSNINKHIDKKVLDTQKYIDNNLIQIIKDNPKTKFILVLPPYPRVKFAMYAQYQIGNFTIYQKMIRYIAMQSAQMKNLKLYGWGEKAFLDDIANYKDTSHYNYKINSWMIDMIQDDKGLLTTLNINKYLTKIKQKALDFDLVGFGNKVDEYLNKYGYK